MPQITLSAPTVGSGLQVGASVSLGASNHGGVTVHVASTNPAVVLVSPDATTPGTASIDVVVPNGTGSFSYYVQGLEQAVGTPHRSRPRRPPSAAGTGLATVQQPAFELQGLPANATTFGTDNPALRSGRAALWRQLVALHGAECPGRRPGPAHRHLHHRAIRRLAPW